jgi:hypothetical protein
MLLAGIRFHLAFSFIGGREALQRRGVTLADLLLGRTRWRKNR